MGFRSRARARKQERMNILGSNRDIATSPPSTPPSDNVLASEVEDQGTILGVVEQPELSDEYKEALVEDYKGTVLETVSVDDVPQGTTNEVKEWVGNSVPRARAAYEKEQASDKPRKSLTSHLKGLLDDE